MWVPVIRGVIERRLLINYRVEPEILARLLPKPFRPQVHQGRGVAGICLIRLSRIRPRGLPAWTGFGSENAAHRAAVEWDGRDGLTRTGVYIFRRDTSSCLNALSGGRVFPGVHYRSRFCASQMEGRIEVTARSRDGKTTLKVAGCPSQNWPAVSVFKSLSEASAFFQGGSLGFSPGRLPGHYQGMELQCLTWQPQAFAIEQVESSLFDDERTFPRGSIALDCGLFMQRVEHEWHSRETICCHAAAGSGSSAASDSTTSA